MSSAPGSPIAAASSAMTMTTFDPTTLMAMTRSGIVGPRTMR